MKILQNKEGRTAPINQGSVCILSLLEALSNSGVPSTRIVFAGHVDRYGGELVTTGKRGKSVFVAVGGGVADLFLISSFIPILNFSVTLDSSDEKDNLGIDEEETEWNNVSTEERSPAQSLSQDKFGIRWPDDQLWCLEDFNLSPIRQQPADVPINILFLKSRCDAIDAQLRRTEATLQKINDEGSSDHSQKEETQTPHALETMETEESDKTEHVLSLREIVSRGWNRLTETRETRHIFDEDTLLD
ncbi:hypothetical protein BLNAU_18519 [Blattamonas nauphoetae]|uniref:Uncharacterized protein n=1 Tax=Blattamonas nauphoetae TaxID=2049346 RepID=A0ABQ9X4L9_9EUKA|nr:hypothetical protein BLNAU_18519 [Blattamonas nauphoetae]